MPRNHIKDDDLDFKIFVDPSCLGEPVEDSELPASTNTDTTAQPSMATDQLPDAVLPDSESAKETSTVTVDDIDVPQEQKVEDVMVDKEEGVTPAAQAADSPAVEEQQEDALAEPTEETSHDSAAPEEADTAPSVQDQDQPTVEAEPEHKEEEQDQAGSQLDNDKQEEPSPTEHVSIVESETAAEQQDAVDKEQETEDVDKATEEPQPKEQDVSLQEEESHLDDETSQAAPQDEPAEDADATETRDLDDATDHVVRSVSSQAFTDRKTSLRTEALIQAAARAVVAKLERRKASRDSMQPEDEPEDVEHSILSTATEEGDTLLQYDHEETPSRRQSTNSTGSQLHHDVPSGDEGGESSSHHEPESDDVFSDRSARSSMASFDNNPPPPAEEEDLTIKSRSVQQHDLDQSDRHSVRSTNTHTRSPRVSGVSMISDLSQYDKEDFVPTSREARLPFRTPSAIRNIQMSSPTPSVIHGVSPRSSKRCQNGGGGLPTISRLGSPTVTTAQFSPKSRSTPTRLKPRREAPLVLLHVTVLPLRWMWGDILNCLDALDGKTYGETKETFQASEQLRSLRDSWRELQDHVTDTVLERGVLMPHPQDDFEVLEERFLDSLELPLRRRARILECGHYLGPSNEFGPDEEGFEESEDEYAEEKRHWCNTCRNEIKYEDLGPGKVFRVKVYASNGLMRAGAWEACWKEMERVDIEVEPIVEMSVQNELEKLVVINGELEEQRQREMEQAEAEAEAAAAQAARDEEARLSILAQSRPQSVAANAMLVQELVFNDEQAALPASRSLMDTPTQDQQARSSAIISSPGAASMQMMHASPAQPPSTMASMRFASPSPQPTQSSPLRHAILPPEDPIPEEPPIRYGDTYGDTPQQPLPLEPAHVDSQAIYTHHPTSSSMSTSMPMTRHADPHIPPTPRSPSEEAYERRHRRTSSSRGRSTHSHHSHNQKHEYNTSRAPPSLENASFIELLLEAFKVLLRDPKNVAIIVLCLFLMAILVRPSASSSAQNGLQLVPRADMNGDGNEQLGGYHRYEAKAVEPVVVQVESAAGSVVVPEAASVLVVTTTVTSTPAAEASLDVEVAVAAETEVVGVDDIESGSAEEAAVMAEGRAQDIIASDSALEGVEKPVVEVAENVDESLDSLSAAPGNATVSVLAEEDQAKAEGTNQTEASIPVLAELNQEPPSLNMTNTADVPEPAEEEEEETASTIAPVEEPAPIVAQEKVLIGPQNIETSTASTSETETASQEPNVATATPSMSAAPAGATNGTEAKDPCQSVISQKTTLRIIETITETVTVSAVASTATSSETKVTSEAESKSKSASESESTAEGKSASTTATEQVATVSAPASVSESVLSMLETTTVAPSLTTVQETVYETETETVRVTVSVGGSASRASEA